MAKRMLKMIEVESLSRQSWGKVVGGCLVALLVGIAQPFLFALSLMFMATPVIICLLFAWAGIAPALLASLTSMLSIQWLFGSQTMWYAFAVTVAPAWFAIGWFRRRLPFFRQVRMVAALEFAVLLAAIGLLYLQLRTDLIDAFMDMLRGWFAGLPGALQDLALRQFAAAQWFSESAVNQIAAGSLSAAERSALIDQFAARLGYSLKLSLPGILACSSILTGLLIVYLPALVCARRGDEPPAAYVAIEGWFLPASVVSGLLVSFAASILLEVFGVVGADTLTTTVLQVILLLCAIQGAAALSRQMKVRGVSRGKRTALLLLSVVFAEVLLQIAGGASALFGRRGLISGYMKKKSHEKGDEDR